MIDAAVSKLAVYALRTGLIEESEYLWAVNTILDTLKLDSYTDLDRSGEKSSWLPCWRSCWTTHTPGAY